MAMDELIHELKTWPKYFQAIVRGDKCFEVRKNDRNYQIGDVLKLREYDPESESSPYTGAVAERRIAYLAQGIFGLPEDVCVMSLAALARDGKVVDYPGEGGWQIRELQSQLTSALDKVAEYERMINALDEIHGLYFYLFRDASNGQWFYKSGGDIFYYNTALEAFQALTGKE